jgi:transcriptional regulator with XRE-family HTH domain
MSADRDGCLRTSCGLSADCCGGYPTAETVSALRTQGSTRRRRRASAGEWLRNEREQRGLTQKQLATMLRVSGASLSSYERGVSAPADGTCEDLGRIFVTSPSAVRRRFGLYVPEDTVDQVPPAPATVLEAILADPRLLPEAKEHLVRTYRFWATAHACRGHRRY